MTSLFDLPGGEEHRERKELNYDALARPYQSSSDTSRDAALRARAFAGEQGQRVFAWIRSTGRYGCTQKEASAALGISRQSLCPRFFALEGLHEIVKTSGRRDGCAVYRVND